MDASRRDFIRGGGMLAGAAALGLFPTELFAAPRAMTAAQVATPYPELNDRAVGWLRFLWEKSTTPDDWSRWGVPHPWWDRYSIPGVTSYPRFDLQYSAYALIVLADQTPAWREVYTRIADELATRYVTYWGAVDWLTQIGDDPARESYPPQFLAQIPEEYRGRYNRIGWVANGVEPWGLQEDPIGADGNLFYRGWLNLTLSIYRYVSGDDKWERPFAVTGYRDQEFEWDHHRLVEHLERQWTDHPEGPHCENTKIWPFCNSAAALGQYLYDRIHGTERSLVVRGWLEYVRDNYMGITADGRLEWFTSWYDPLIDYKANGGPGAGLDAAFLMLPQEPEIAAIVYEATANAQGWNDRQAPARPSSTGLLLARELGDDVAVERLTAANEAAFQPRFFGDDGEMFGWWFNHPEPYPRGQQSAVQMLSEIGRGGDWSWAFQAQYMDKFGAPTVQDVDFPAMGVRQAWNDPETGVLHVATYAVTPDRRGQPTEWRVTNLPDAGDIVIRVDGQPFDRFEVEGPDTVRLDADIGEHRYEIRTGYRSGAAGRQARTRNEAPGPAARTAVRSLAGSASAASVTAKAVLASPPPTCACCAGGA